MTYDDIKAEAPAIPVEREDGAVWTFSPGVGWLRDGMALTSREEAEYTWQSLPDKSRYGYKLDVSDPTVAKYFRIFKQRLGLPPHMPISDQERKEFELQYLTAVIERRRRQREQG